MSISAFFPVFSRLSAQEQTELSAHTQLRSAKKGTILHNGMNDCLGLLVVRSGQLRAFLTSDEGREVTLYRLFERDICLFSASCMMNSIQFDITISAEKDTDFFLIDPAFYKRLMEKNADVANYTSQIMATRFTDVMWLMEQVMFKSFDQRLAHFLITECDIEQSNLLRVTHERIAAHLGTAREVVTRMLKYFQTEGMVSLARGSIEVLNTDALQELGGLS